MGDRRTKVPAAVERICRAVMRSVADVSNGAGRLTQGIRIGLRTLFQELELAGYAVELESEIGDIVRKRSQEWAEMARRGVEEFEGSTRRIHAVVEKYDCQEALEACQDENYELRHFTQDLLLELQNAEGVIEKLRLEMTALEKRSQLDPLTNAYNRAVLEADLTALFDGAGKNLDLVALMIDIDNFKALNDSHGHLAGDKALVMMHRLLKKSVREYDRIYRYGGEEFVVLINRIDRETARSIAERIVRTVRETRMLYRNRRVDMTVSVGMAARHPEDTPETLIERADRAVYAAKRSGKDRVVDADELESV